MFNWKEFWRTLFEILGGATAVFLIIVGVAVALYLLANYPVTVISTTAIGGLLGPAIRAGLTK